MNRIRVVIALVVVSVLFLALVYNKFEQSLFADKVDNLELQLKNQVSTMATAYEADSKFILKWAQTLSNEGTRHINWNAMSPYFAVAKLNTSFQVVEWSFRESSPISSLSKETLTQLVYSYQISPESTQISYQFYQDQEKKRILLTLVPVKGQLWVFASLGENLQSLMDNQKTLSSSLALVNKDLVSVAHVKPEYVRQKIFENTVIKDLRENNKTMSSGSFAITSGEEFFAVIEKIPNMELYLYTQTSLSDIIKSKSDFRRQFAFFSSGFLFLLIGILFLLMPKEKSDAPAATSNVTPAKQVAPPPPAQAQIIASPSPMVATQDAKMTSPERMQTNMKIASALGHEMKAPLVKILSLVQMGNFSESKEEMAKVLSTVKAEVRSASEVVDKLLLFAGEKEQNRIKTKIETPLLRAIKNLEPVCYQKVIKITKELNANDSFDMDVNQLVIVFENILRNSIQALDRKSNKEIKIKTFSEKGKVYVLIEDNGEGIAKEISDKIFDPFFTSLNVSQHMGLGLTVALGIAKQHNGNVIVDSERGKGTRVQVEFALEQVQKPAAAVAEIITHNNLSGEEKTVLIEDEISPIVEEPPAIAQAAIVENMPTTFNIPQILSIPAVEESIVLNIDEEPEAVSASENEKEEKIAEKPANDDNDNEMFQELDLSAKPISVKPIDLNVDVDELFEVASEAVTVKIERPAPIDQKVAEPVPAKPVTPKVASLFTPPSAPVSKKHRPSDDFKAVIRKPGRPM